MHTLHKWHNQNYNILPQIIVQETQNIKTDYYKRWIVSLQTFYDKYFSVYPDTEINKYFIVVVLTYDQLFITHFLSALLSWVLAIYKHFKNNVFKNEYCIRTEMRIQFFDEACSFMKWVYTGISFICRQTLGQMGPMSLCWTEVLSAVGSDTI